MHAARICLLCGSTLDLQAYRALLETCLRLTPAVESDFAAASVWRAMRADPQLALAAADRPSAEVRDAIEMITLLRPACRVLVASAAVDPNVLVGWSRCALSGYVVKNGGVEELQRAIEAVVSGQRYFSEGVEQAFTTVRNSNDPRSQLSRRERELLPLLARGMTLRDAAAMMEISYKTADSYRSSLLRKLGVRDRVELARYAIREQLIDP